RRSRADRAGEIPEGLRDVRAASCPPDAGGEREIPEDELRAPLRRGQAQRAGVGTGQRQGDRSMRNDDRIARAGVVLLAWCVVLEGASRAGAQTAPDDKPTVEIYGFGQADAIADFKQNDPNWYDVNRPSRLPNVAGQ